MEAVKKYWFWGIFISILCIFAMSHNTFALDLTTDVEFSRKINVTSGACAVQGGALTSFSGPSCVWGINVGGALEGRGLSLIQTQYISGISSSKIYEVYLTVATTDNGQWSIPVVWSPTATSNYSLLSYEQVSINDNLGTESSNEGYVSTYRFILRPLVNGTYPIQLGDETRAKNMLYIVGTNVTQVTSARFESITEWNIKAPMSDQNIVNAINDLKRSEQQQREDEREELEQGQEDLNDAGEDSTEEASQATSNLLDIIGSFVGAVSSATPTNCRINGNMGKINLGDLNLCANPVPSFIQVIGSLILILIFVPLAIVMFNRFINLFRSFQN